MSQRTPDETALYNIVIGGLKDAINHHGPIGRGDMLGAAKRIVGSMVAYIQWVGAESIAKDTRLAQLEAELRDTKRQKATLRKNRNDLLKIVRAHGLPLSPELLGDSQTEGA